MTLCSLIAFFCYYELLLFLFFFFPLLPSKIIREAKAGAKKYVGSGVDEFK